MPPTERPFGRHWPAVPVNHDPAERTRTNFTLEQRRTRTKELADALQPTFEREPSTRKQDFAAGVIVGVAVVLLALETCGVLLEWAWRGGC